MPYLPIFNIWIWDGHLNELLGNLQILCNYKQKKKYIFTETFPDKYNLQNNFYILKTF